MEALKAPAIKQELGEVKVKWQKDQLELEEIKMGYRKLEDSLQEQKTLSINAIDEERKHYLAQIAELLEKQRRDIEECKFFIFTSFFNQHCKYFLCLVNKKHQEELQQTESRLQNENEKLNSQLKKEILNRENAIRERLDVFIAEHNQKIKELELKNDRLKQEHQISLEILREENDSIRDQLDDKNALVQDLDELKLVNDRLKLDFNEKERYYEEKLSAAHDEISMLKEENRKILETFKSDTKDNKLHVSIYYFLFT